MSTRPTIFFDRLLVTEFLDAHRVWEEKGGEELLSLLRYAARKVEIWIVLGLPKSAMPR
jgi:hypothetical protein